MGADIFAYLEKRNRQGKWEVLPIEFGLVDGKIYEPVYEFLYGYRNSEFFQMLGEENSLFNTNKGFPVDASKFVSDKHKSMIPFVYGSSYLSLNELVLENKEIEKEFKGHDVEPLKNFIELMRAYFIIIFGPVNLSPANFREKAPDLRVVYWFSR